MGSIDPAFFAANGNSVPAQPPIRLGLVLAGGGVLGKFTHGALKELAQDQQFQSMLASGQVAIKAITGTSAGAVTGTVMTGHLNAGNGLAGGIHALDHLWGTIGKLGIPGQMRQQFMRAVFPLFTPAYPNLPRTEEFFFDQVAANLPDGYAPKWIAAQLKEACPDWQHVQKGPVALYLNAVKAPQGGEKASHVVFTGSDITPLTAAASTALKNLGGLTINGTKYWDGGYWRNPSLDGMLDHDLTDMLVFPLCEAPDQIIPSLQDEWSTANKLSNKKTVSKELYHELASLTQTHPDLHQHVINLKPGAHWDETTKMNNDPTFMADLEARGRLAMRQWLDHNLSALGHAHSTVDHNAPVFTRPPASPRARAA